MSRSLPRSTCSTASSTSVRERTLLVAVARSRSVAIRRSPTTRWVFSVTTQSMPRTTPSSSASGL
jgi:hypothetical protein